MIKVIVLLLISCSCIADTVYRVRNIVKDTQGTAFSIEYPKGTISTLTAGHVCEGTTALIVRNDDLVRVAAVRRVAKDNDICLLSSVSTLGFKLAEMSKVNEHVTAPGYPHGVRMTLNGPTMKYFYSAQFNEFSQEIQLEIQPGNSGSPVLNDDGDLVGLVTGNFEKAKTGIMVPVELIKNFLDTL